MSKVKSFRGKTAQEIQDEIFQRMSMDKKMKLGSDFSMFCMQNGFSEEGTPIPFWYLIGWLRKNSTQQYIRLKRMLRLNAMALSTDL
jgi:threonyl-tRNA synthetase